jgi:hypothetical protein
LVRDFATARGKNMNLTETPAPRATRAPCTTCCA